MTYSQALKLGATVHHSAWTKGYVSRKADIGSLVLLPCNPKGRYKDLQYIDAPSWDSTRYHVHIYLDRAK